ncbi:MAG: low molecular weight phosphotyrosine protein phosphatase [Clostridia bacterium]|nr:low molecular weight phosphotyrosine protein phosphatase [Clostridia bacterium]
MNRIMFVCHGNICRSPMAEFIMKHLVNTLGISDRYFIASSATSPEELYSPMYPPAQRELSRHGVPYERREATLLSKEDYNRFDIFALMDERNLRNISRIFTSDPEGKICKLMSFTGNPRDVSDPWYSGDFATAYNDIFEGCVSLLISLEPTLTRAEILRTLSDRA